MLLSNRRRKKLHDLSLFQQEAKVLNVKCQQLENGKIIEVEVIDVLRELCKNMQYIDVFRWMR